MLYASNNAAIPKTPRDNPPTYRSPQEHGLPFRDVSIRTADGCILHGWLILHPDGEAEKRTTVLYFHGNAGNIGLRLPLLEDLYKRLGVNILAVDYRGYGMSTGVPSWPGLQEDAMSSLRYLIEQSEIDPTRLVVFGRSLGGAVAAWLAARPCDEACAGVVLENTWVTLGELAAHLFTLLKLFRWLLPYMVKVRGGQILSPLICSRSCSYLRSRMP